MSEVIRRNTISIIILVSIILGFILPQIGLLWKSGTTILLGLLMFFSSLRIETTDIARSVKNPKLVLTSLFIVFVFTPLLAYPTKLFFEPIIFAGLLLAFCSPSAIVTAFWSRIMKGDVAFALVISTLANIASIITIPVTILIATGAAANVNALSMILTLSETVLLPIIVSIGLKRTIKINWSRVTNNANRFEPFILAMLIWGSIAPGVSGALDAPFQFVILTAYVFVALGCAFAVGHFMGRMFGSAYAITVGIAACIKNAALALVIGLTLFGPQILTPLIANLLAQNLLIVPLQFIFKNGNQKN